MTPQNRNFTSVFDVQCPFRAKGVAMVSCEMVAMDTSKSQFYCSFGRPTSISCERVAMD